MIKFFAACSLFFCLAGCDRVDNKASADLVITNVNVIDVLSGDIHTNQTLVIRDGLIADILQAGNAGDFAGAKMVDHSGHYAMPGLWDMHIHIRGGPDLVDDNERLLTRYLGYGVTGVRDAAGDLSDEVLAWREAVAAGRMEAPVIFTSLRKLEGPTGGWPGSLRIDNESDIDTALDTLSSDHPDFIKIYSSSIAPGLYLESIRKAEKRGFKTAAHMLFSVPFEDTIAAGLDSIEHALYLHKAASTEDRAISSDVRKAREGGNGSEAGDPFVRMMASYDRDHAFLVFKDLARRGVAVTPTLYIDHLLRFLDENDHMDDPELAQIPAAIRETYQGRVEGALRRSPEAIERDHRRMQATIALTGLAHEAGVTLLAGSDTGASNSYVYPGDSLHQELRMLVEAGLSPLDALRAATVNGARWLDQTERYGSIEKGKAADILILEKNPLEAIENTRSAAALIRAGAYMDADKLRSLRILTRR